MEKFPTRLPCIPEWSCKNESLEIHEFARHNVSRTVCVRRSVVNELFGNLVGVEDNYFPSESLDIDDIAWKNR